MTEACARRIKNLKVFKYVCVTSQTCYAHATGTQQTQQTFNVRFTHTWDMLLKQYLIKSESACSIHWRALNVRQMRSKHIQRTCNVRGTYFKRTRHTPWTRRASRNFLSMFKNYLSPNAPGACSDSQQRISTCTKSTKRACNTLLTCHRHAPGVC